MSVFLIDRPRHAEQPWQDVNEDSPHPRCHGVSLGAPKMNIENHHSHTNAIKKKYLKVSSGFYVPGFIRPLMIYCNATSSCMRQPVWSGLVLIKFVDQIYYLNVSRIMVKRTNFPRRGTTREVGGMISARRRKNTVRESRMLIERLT